MWNSISSKNPIDAHATICDALEKMFTLTSVYEGQLASAMRARSWNPQSSSGNDATRFYPSITDLTSEFGNPYKQAGPFETRVEKYIETIYKSSAQKAQFKIKSTIRKLIGNPRSILEVGSFIGSGIVNVWAPLVQNMTGTVISLDTWDGALCMKLHTHDHITKFTNRSLYDTFGSRMITRKLTNVVYPMRMPSLMGARLLYYLGYKFDAIYVDSAHEIGETLIELKLFHDLLRPGGVLMGDDYSWTAVRHDTALFSKCTGTIIHPIPNTGQWYLQKPFALESK